MAFNANSSDEKVVKEGKLYTGLANMKIVAVNPNKAQLEALGYKPQNEPVYLTIGEDGNEKLRLDFHLLLKGESHTIMTKIAFFLENKERLSKDGKAEWIDIYGKTAWNKVTAPTDKKWFDATTSRHARHGESDLHTFLINWLNISPGDEAKLEHFDAMFTGDYSEIQGILIANPDNEVRVLLTVRDGKYQSVYNRYFDRATNQRTNYWESHIKKQTVDGYPPKEDFSGSFAFQEWVEPTGMNIDASTSTPANDDGKNLDDDPF